MNVHRIPPFRPNFKKQVPIRLRSGQAFDSLRSLRMQVNFDLNQRKGALAEGVEVWRGDEGGDVGGSGGDGVGRSALLRGAVTPAGGERAKAVGAGGVDVEAAVADHPCFVGLERMRSEKV